MKLHTEILTACRPVVKFVLIPIAACSAYVFLNNVVINIALLIFNPAAFPRLYLSGYICGGETSLPASYVARCVTIVVLRLISFTLLLYLFRRSKLFLFVFAALDIVCFFAVLSKVQFFTAPYFCNYFCFTFSYWIFGNYHALIGLLGMLHLSLAFVIARRRNRFEYSRFPRA